MKYWLYINGNDSNPEEALKFTVDLEYQPITEETKLELCKMIGFTPNNKTTLLGVPRKVNLEKP